MIKYLGSKKKLLPAILDAVGRMEKVRSVGDLFSGTSRVGHALKNAGYQVFSNDHNAYAYLLGKCYVQSDSEDWLQIAKEWIHRLNALPGAPGYFTQVFCRDSRFFQEHNGARVDAIRDAIRDASLPDELEAILIVSLMEAADRVDSTTGVQMAYLKDWAARSYNKLELRVPDLAPRSSYGKSTASMGDAVAVARSMSADCVYLDPPYNQHKYLGNYHIWETLALWDQPESYGIAMKRMDCRSRASDFNSKKTIYQAMKSIVESLDCRFLLVSFSNEGFISREEMFALLATRGEVEVLEFDYKRYVGAQIGIHNPQGKKVGQISHLRNTEMLFVVSPHGCRLLGASWGVGRGQATLF